MKTKGVHVKNLESKIGNGRFGDDMNDTVCATNKKGISEKKKGNFESSKRNIKKIKMKIKKKSNKTASSDTEESESNDYSASLNKLKEIDPEFYEYLERNDEKLLKFDPHSDDEDSSGDDSNVDDGDDEQFNQTTVQTLEAASDESDFEDENNTTRKENTITLKLLKYWQVELTAEKVSSEVIKNVILALNSTLMTLAGAHQPHAKVYQVEGAAAFNGVVQLCVLHLEPAIRRFLGLHKKTALQPHKCKKWNKIKSSLRGYFTDITKLLEQVSSSNILVVLLKHIHQSIPMILSFTSLIKPILKRLVTIWSTGDETVRVLAFLSILRITRSQNQNVLSIVLKAMYLSYVRNSKFVSPSTLPAINFMRRSLSEMFALDLNISYQYIFLYIRQLAIHLRNATTLKMKKSYQTVYNWQYINSIRLWTDLLSATFDRTQLQPLIYPLVTIIIGVIKLIPTAQFFPLRFHCINTLIQLSTETRTFIPIMPLILEVLKSNTFNQRHTKVSMKPLSFTCILRLNKGQLSENGFRDEVIERIIGCTLNYMAHESFSLSYPESVVPTIIKLKTYLKENGNIKTNHRTKLKLLVEKLEENSQFIISEREKFTFDLHEASAIHAWETQIRNKGTPLLLYYTNWINTQNAVQKRQNTISENIDVYNIPTIRKRKQNIDDSGNQKKEDTNNIDLLPSDDDDELMLEIERNNGAIKEKRTKKENPERVSAREATNHNSDYEDGLLSDEFDIVHDFDINDW